MTNLLYLIAALVLTAALAPARAESGIAQLVPRIEQLGPGWTSNRVVVLVDPLSSPPLLADKNEGSGWLVNARAWVAKTGEAQAVLRCYRGEASVLVWINRFHTPKDIGNNWGFDKSTKKSPPTLPAVGEEVRFYQRDGLHNNFAFRRANYLIDVEGMSVEIEHLKHLAEVLDLNLLKALAAPKSQSPPPQK